MGVVASMVGVMPGVGGVVPGMVETFPMVGEVAVFGILVALRRTGSIAWQALQASTILTRT